MYKIINKDNARVFLVGDLHGCYSKLMRELMKVDFDFSRDLVVCTGDLIDRGKKSLDCLKLIEKPWFESVRGNHDDLAYFSVILNDKETRVCWKANGGGWFNQYDSEHIEAVNLIGQLPYIIELNRNGLKYVVAHADYPSNSYKRFKLFDVSDLTWSRERFQSDDNFNIEGADVFVFGHSPVEGPTKKGNCLYIDCGAVFTGNMQLIEI